VEWRAGVVGVPAWKAASLPQRFHDVEGDPDSAVLPRQGRWPRFPGVSPTLGASRFCGNSQALRALDRFSGLDRTHPIEGGLARWRQRAGFRGDGDVIRNRLAAAGAGAPRRHGSVGGSRVGRVGDGSVKKRDASRSFGFAGAGLWATDNGPLRDVFTVGYVLYGDDA
jgi:hypothetical protein